MYYKLKYFLLGSLLAAALVCLTPYLVSGDEDSSLYAGWASGFAALVIIFGLLHLGIERDNRIFLETIRRHEKCLISHRLSGKRLLHKLARRQLLPYSPVRSGLPKFLVDLMDGKEKSIWVSPGAPADVHQLLLGTVSTKEWVMALSFEVSSADIVMPPTLIKRLFGTSQQRILKTVDIPDDADIYTRVSGRWEKLEGKERDQWFDLADRIASNKRMLRRALKQF